MKWFIVRLDLSLFKFYFPPIYPIKRDPETLNSELAVSFPLVNKEDTGPERWLMGKGLAVQT